MAHTQQTQPTKDAALKQLGLNTKRSRDRVSGQFDYAHVSAGRRLLTQNTFMPAVIVAMTGSANVSFEGTHVAHLEAPFVLDGFLADDRRVVQYDVVANSDTCVLVVDQRRRSSVFEQVPALARLSSTTQTHIDAQTVIDVTEAVSTSISLPT